MVADTTAAEQDNIPLLGSKKEENQIKAYWKSSHEDHNRNSWKIAKFITLSISEVILVRPSKE